MFANRKVTITIKFQTKRQVRQNEEEFEKASKRYLNNVGELLEQNVRKSDDDNFSIAADVSTQSPVLMIITLKYFTFNKEKT